jgi:multiple sugar transport system substrate-binding protein
MKKPKRERVFIPLIVSALGVLLVLTGCSKSAQKITLDFMYWNDSQATKQYFEDVASKFQSENPKVTINLQVVPPGDQYYGQLDTRIAGKQAPDTVRLEYQKLGKYADAGALLDLTNYINKANLADVFPAFVSAVTFNGKLYGMPHHTDTYALFYNKALLQKAGISVPTSIDKAWTWDQFLDVAKTVKQKTGVKYAFTYRWVKTNGYYVDPLIYMGGASLTTDDLTRANMNTPQGIDFFKYIQTWVKDRLVPAVSPNTPDPVDTLFTSGVSALIFSGSWMMEYYDKNFKDQWGVTYLIQKDGRTGATFGGNAISATVQTKHPKEAAKFVEFMTNADNSKAICAAAGFLPVRNSLLNGGVTYQRFNDEMQVFIKQASKIDPKMMKVEGFARFSEINQVLGDSIEKIVVGKGDPGQVAKDMDDAVNKILSEK